MSERGEDLPAQKLKNKQALQEPDSFQQQIQAVASDIASNQEQNRALANRDYIYDNQGRIVDVKFTQNGNSRRLKEVLPVPEDYVIELVPQEELEEESPEGLKVLAYHNPVRRVLKLSDGLSSQENGKFNIVILHEAGHAADYGKNKNKYLPVQKKLTIVNLKGVAVLLKQAELQTSKPYLNEFRVRIPEELERYLDASSEEIRSYFSEQEYQSIVQELNQFSAALEQQTSLTDLSQLDELQRRDAMEAETLLRSLTERQAWAEALHAYRSLRKENINVHEGTPTEVINLMHEALDVNYC